MLLFLPQIHPNPQQQKNHDLWKSRSRARGVAKTVFGVPMLHGKHCCLCFPCSVGVRFVIFATPPQREFYVFHVFPHVPSEKLKNHENHIMESCCGRVGAKDAKSKSPPESHLPPVDTIGTLFLTSAKIQQVN